MNPIWLVTLAVFAPVASGAIGLCMPRSWVGTRVALSVLGPVAAVLLLAELAITHGVDHTGAGGVLAAEWMPELKLNWQWHPDRFGVFFALLVSGIGVLITLYARAYFGPDRDSLYRFYPSLLLFMTAMLGVVLADSFMLLLLFWEMTSISSFLLIGWERDDPAAVKKAMQAFIVTGAGGLVLMGGLILIGVHTDVWSFSALAGLAADGRLSPGPLLTTGFLMVFAGAAAKSAQFPLHFWLPGAMAAPTPVSAYLHSATMVKAGVYLVGRLWPILAAVLPVWPSLIVPLGAVTMVYGAFIALQKTDLKQIFAYTTISQLGLLMAMYGLAAFQYGGHGEHTQPNMIWEVAQILNHALYKAPLFILAGAIGHIASRELPKLKGLFYRDGTSRIMTVVVLAAAYCLAAGPLTVSFTAKEFFFYQIWHAYEATHQPVMGLLILAGVLTGMFNVAIFIRLARTLLSRQQPEADPHEHHDAHGHDHEHEKGIWPAFLWIPGAVIVSVQFIGGIIPGAYEAMFGWLEASPYYFEAGHFPLLWNVHPGVPLYMSLCAIGLGVGLGFAPLMRGKYNDPFDHAYPSFYLLATKGGGRVFRILQGGHVTGYIAFVAIALVGFFAWSIRFDFASLPGQWPGGAGLELDQLGELLPGILLTFMVCLTALLMPFVRDRASRVLILGACGFSVTGVYYQYRAPDLALTQISIEIVSLILFLLVLSMLPKQAPGPRLWVVPRVVLGAAVGLIMFWLTLTSSVGPQPTIHYLGRQYANLGEFFLRNSHHGEDSALAATDHGTLEHSELERRPTTKTRLYHGGGGKNVVNVILVDFRGFDTLGEITVLGIAAMGVWTLVRRRHGFKSPRERVMDEEQAAETGSRGLSLDIPEPTGGHDPEDDVVNRMIRPSTES